MINGKNYDFSSITAKIPGMTLEFQDISYDDGLEKEVTYGKGSMPRGYGSGNYKANAKLSMLRDDFNDLIDYCKKKNVSLYKLEIPKITVAFANDGQRTKIDVINKIGLTKVSDKAAQGDKSLKVDIDLIVYGKIIRDGLEPV